MVPRLRIIVRWSWVLALGASLLANVFLYRYALQKTRDLASVTLDPHGRSVHRQANQTVASQKDRVRVVLLGDSRIQQWTTWAVKPDREILNRGVGGQTTHQVLGRIETDVLALHPDVVLLQLGINDLKAIGLYPAHRDAIAKACAENIIRIARQCQDAGAEVVLLTIFPRGPLEWARRAIWSPEIDTALSQVNQQLMTLKEPRVRVVDCSQLLAENGEPNAIFYDDALHLSDQGYAMLTSSLTPLLDTLIASLEVKR